MHTYVFRKFSVRTKWMTPQKNPKKYLNQNVLVEIYIEKN